MSIEQVATKSTTAVKAGEKQTIADNSDNNSDSSSTTSSQELVWAPRPYYFCNKCLITLGLPEPEERQGNYLIEKKVVAEVRQAKEASGSEKVSATKRQNNHQQQQQQKQGSRKKIRLLLDDE